MSILKLSEVSKSFGKGQKVPALTECSFSLEEGKVCAIVGESGSGKTTLLRLIAGIETTDKGTICIDQKVVSSDSMHVPPQERSVGMVFQNYALFPHLTVEQNIRYGAPKASESSIASILDMLNLSGLNKRYPHELSGGQQQRVAIGRSLIRNPKLLLMDEPFASLDTHLKTSIRREIRDVIKSQKLSMVFITHDIIDALDIADVVVFLHQSRIERFCSVAEAFKEVPEGTYTAKTLENLGSDYETISKILT